MQKSNTCSKKIANCDKIKTKEGGDSDGDIDIGNTYSRQQLLALLESYFKMQQQNARQARLTNNPKKEQIAVANMEHAKRIYTKIKKVDQTNLVHFE